MIRTDFSTWSSKREYGKLIAERRSFHFDSEYEIVDGIEFSKIAGRDSREGIALDRARIDKGGRNG